MPIDFSSLVSKKEVIVPVLQKSFQYHRKKYSIEAEDGWWVVEIQNNRTIAKEPYFWATTNSKYNCATGYSYGNQIVFNNFDVAHRLWGANLIAPLHFNSVDTFSAINVVFWETNQFFYICPNYSDIKICDVKMAFDNEQSLDTFKGITPELRTLYLFHSFERDQLREILKQKTETENHEKRMKEIPYRLKMTLERAGATLIGYSQSGNRLIVDWELVGGGFKYNSVIDATTWMCCEAGYCLSGGDKKLNLTALVKTAEEYEDRDVIFITRH